MQKVSLKSIEKKVNGMLIFLAGTHFPFEQFSWQ